LSNGAPRGAAEWLTQKKSHDDPRAILLCEQFYRQTGNPIHAWEGWRLARKNELPIPTWVAGYLDGCSVAIDKIARKIGPPPTLSRMIGKKPRASGKKPDIPAALAKGFGFSKGHGHRGSFTEWMTNNERVLIARRVAKEMAEGESLSSAAAEVAHKLKISDSTAERAFRGLGDTGPRLVEELKFQAGRRDSSP
jgi:hypothetical protein